MKPWRVLIADDEPKIRSGLSGQIARMNVNADRKAILRGADCVLYAGDPQAASRFAMDRSALGSDREEEGDSGLTDQARVNGGIGGLMHALRAGTAVFRLCDEMAESCPEALVINLGQPVARTTELFVRRGFRCYGLGDSPLRGPIGLEAIRKLLKTDGKKEEAVIAGLPGFAFLLSLKEDGQDQMPRLRRAVREGELGNLSRRWLNWWDAVPVGDATAHAEFLPAQPDYIPAERPSFGESVERRKERILYMNTVAEQGADAREGAMAQLLLLSHLLVILLTLLEESSAVHSACVHSHTHAHEAHCCACLIACSGVHSADLTACEGSCCGVGI